MQISEKNKWIMWCLMALFLLLLAAILYFSSANYTTSFTNDEFQSASVAMNYSEGKGFVSKTGLRGPSEYTRAWPATLLLAGWIKLWGFSEVSCRSLSAVYGLLFVLSAIFITYKMFKNIWYSFVSVSAMVVQYNLVKYFSTTRMYSLEMLLSIWLYYFLYMGISKKNPFAKRKTETDSNEKNSIIAELLDYHWGYIISAIPLLYLCRHTMINSLIPILGVCFYIIVKAFASKEKKYVFGVIIGFTGIALIGINFLLYLINGKFLFLSVLFKALMHHFQPSFLPEYFKFVLGAGFAGRFYFALPIILFIAITCIVKKHIDDVMVFIICIVSATVLFFVFFTGSHPFTERYILMLVPWAIMLYAYAVICLDMWETKLSLIFIIGGLVFELLYGGRRIYMYCFTENPNDTDFLTAYSKIGEYYDIEAETVPVTYSYLRAYYYTQIIPEEKITLSTSVPRDTATDAFIKMGTECGEGIVTCEEIKMHLLKQGLSNIIYNWTDRISGVGVDKTNVNISYYCFLKPNADETGNADAAMLSDGNLSICLSEDMIARILAVDDDPDVAFVKINMKMSDGTDIERHFCLLMPDMVDNIGPIRYTLSNDLARKLDLNLVSSVVFNPEIAVYSDGELIENINIFE